MKRTLIVCLAFATGLLGTLALMDQNGNAAQEKKTPPVKLTFVTKNGNVTFDHSAHVMREKGDCTTCHDKLFKQDAKAPLNYKPSLHKTAEMDKTACGACHRAGGPSFESKGNCAKCHMKG